MRLTNGPLPPAREWDRLDPDYSDPEPLDWRELANPLLWLAAVAVLVGLWAFIGLAVAVLAPAPAS